jgi:hypothetical protein
MRKPSNVAREMDGHAYKRSSSDAKHRVKIINMFHREVARQILLGNRVILPEGISIEIVKTENNSGFMQPRMGFVYRVRFNIPKMREKRVVFRESDTLRANLKNILKNTSFEYKYSEQWQ